MAQPSPLGADVRQVCALGGVQAKISSRKLVTLKDMEKTLTLAIQEVDSKVSSKSWAAMLVAVKTVKVICDVVVDLMAQSAEKTPAALPAKAVSMIYDRATLVTEGFNGTLDLANTGQHVAETHLDVLGEVVSKPVAEALSRSRTVLKTAQSLFDIYRTADEIADANTGVDSSMAMARAKLREIQGQIRVLEKSYADCGYH